MGAQVPPASAHAATVAWSAATPASHDLAGGGAIVAPTGGVLVEGETESGTAAITVTHFLAGGKLDPCFGVAAPPCAGSGTVDASARSYGITYSGAAIAVQTDGKILAAGGIRWPINASTSSNPYAMAVARLNPNGTPDASFGDGGIAGVNPCGATTRTGQGSAASVTEAPDGRIVMVGTAKCALDSGGQLVVARLTSSGEPDPSFGNGSGYVVYTGAAATSGYDGVVDPSDGAITAVGQEATCAGAGCWLVERLTSGGALDRTLNTTGTITMSPGGCHLSTAYNVALTGGEIIVSGASDVTTPSHSAWYVCAAKLGPDGALDRSFGTAGTMLMSDGNVGSQTMAVEANGDLVFGSTHLTVARALPDGQPDTTFGPGGYINDRTWQVAGYAGRGGAVNGVAVDDLTNTIYAAGTTGTSCTVTAPKACVAFAAAIIPP